MERTGIAQGADHADRAGRGDAPGAPTAPAHPSPLAPRSPLAPTPSPLLDRAVAAAADDVVGADRGRPLQLWVRWRGTVVDLARGELGRKRTDARARRVRPWTCHDVGTLVAPAVALATLAALDAHGLPLEHRARAGATVADVLCGRHPTVSAAQQLATVAGDRAPNVVSDLVAGPLGVAEELVLGGDGTWGVASARALGAVLAAWCTLTRGAAHPALAVPRPGTVRRAWSAASRVVARSEPDGGPAWYGPGLCRNVGGRLSRVLSPLAFGARHGTAALAVCEPDLDLTLAVVSPPAGSPAPTRAGRAEGLPRRLVDTVAGAILGTSDPDQRHFDRAAGGDGA